MARQIDVAVIGGGLAGLTAAAFAARAGNSVTLFEKARSLGGRAATHERRGFAMNLGAHALFRGGEAWEVLASLGVRPKGGAPVTAGARLVLGGRAHDMPTGLWSLLSTGLIPAGAKVEAARALSALERADPAALMDISFAEWLNARVGYPTTRALFAAIARLATYMNDPERQSAGATLLMLQRAARSGVLYVDGGWQTIVDAVCTAATAAGVNIVSGVRVTAIDGGGVVRMEGGRTVRAGAVVIAATPQMAARLVPGSASLRAAAAAAVPVEAACLDVGLSRLPAPPRLVLGADPPLYVSVHSAVARLAPADGSSALVHVMKYLAPGRPVDSEADERECEAMLDLAQPGWRDWAVVRRFLPRMTVANALTTARGGGLGGRHGCAVADAQNVFVAGDWVGEEGLLADASLASARRAARLAAAMLRQERDGAAA